MKKPILRNLTVAITIIAASFCNNMLKAQTIPNGGFETWQMNNTVEQLTGGWVISDEAVLSCGPATSTKSTDAASGNYSLFLQTGMCSSGVHEGWAVITFPVSSKPMYLNFRYKSQHAGPDSAHVFIRMNKRIGSIRQKLAEETYYIKGNQTTYKSVSMPLNYIINDVPDTAIIDISSDGGLNPAVGNQLWIDDLSFSLISDVPAPARELAHTVFPNPAVDILNIRVESPADEEVVFEISDVAGRMLSHSTTVVRGKDITINVADLASGIYFYNISQGSRLSKGKFIKR